MPIALSSIKDELFPGLYDVGGAYEQIETQWKKIFKVHKSKMAIERKTQMRFLGLPSLKSEGASTPFDNNAGQRKVYNAESFEVGLGYAITRKAIDDCLYKSEFDPTNLRMQEVFAQYKEIACANILNNATTYDATIGGDGVSLCNAAHPVDGGTYANRPTIDADLNEATLLQAMTNIPTNFVNEANLRILAKARMLIVPRALEPVAVRLLKTELRPGTTQNDVNAILSTAGGLPDSYHVMDFLTSPYAWFLKTSIEGLILMERISYEMDMQVDFVTDNLLVKGYERYIPTYNDERCVYGSFPTS